MIYLEIHLIIIPTLLLGFIIGFLCKGVIIKENIQLNKNHRDVVNWLKSDLSQEEKVKLGKTENKSKVKYLKLIIKRLSRGIN